MRITTKMLLQLEQAIAPDAEATVWIYGGGCDIRVEYNGGMNVINQRLGSEQLATVAGFGEDKVARTWDRLISRCLKARDSGSRDISHSG
ncbi:MAG: hypothetical protein R3180_00295 [Marinobacter sp.]|nr:hypothetical protein [Marinobacter sp.]